MTPSTDEAMAQKYDITILYVCKVRDRVEMETKHPLSQSLDFNLYLPYTSVSGSGNGYGDAQHGFVSCDTTKGPNSIPDKYALN